MTKQESVVDKQAKYQNLKRLRISSGLISVFVFGIDFLFASPTLTGFILLYLVFILVPIALFSFRNKPKLRYVGNKILIYLILVGVTFVFYAYDLSLARQRSGVIIAAVDQYYQDQGAYPVKLQDLVPAYLPKVPKPRLVPSTFLYRQAPEDTFLMYSGLSPFDRYSWSFINKEWSYID